MPIVDPILLVLNLQMVALEFSHGDILFKVMSDYRYLNIEWVPSPSAFVNLL